jgi:predicted dehydrogenase
LETSLDATSTRVRWGILGPGRIAPRLVRAVGRCPRGELLAVASRAAARAEAFAASHGIPRAYGSYEDLVADPDVDVVYVSLPNHLHAEWTIRALDRGKHVLCEKPLALAPMDVDAIAGAAARSGRICVEAFMYLHHPQILRALELVRGGAVGTLRLVDASFSFPLTYPDDPRIDPSMGGGSLWDVGCYPVSLARRIAGEEADLVAAFARFDERGVDRTFIGQLHFANGLLAQFDCGFAAPDRERVEVVGSDATLVLDAPFLPAPDGPEPTLTMWRRRVAAPIEVESVDQYHAEVEDLTAAILDGTAPRIDLAFTRGTIATLVDLDRAARVNAGLAHAAPATGRAVTTTTTTAVVRDRA